MTKFFVVDDTGGVSWNHKTEKPETFKSYEAAKNRAVELAASEPGQEFFICKPVAAVRANVSAASVTKL